MSEVKLLVSLTVADGEHPDRIRRQVEATLNGQADWPGWPVRVVTLLHNPAGLTQADMAGQQCEYPGCDCDPGGKLVLMSSCHPGARLRVTYESGTLVVQCGRCLSPVGDFALAVS